MNLAAYNAHPAMRWSILSAGCDSGLHLRHRIANPTLGTPAMLLGSAGHAAMLQPELVASIVCVPDAYCTKSGLSTSAEARAWMAQYPADTLMASADQLDRIGKTVAAVHAHEDAGVWLRTADRVEVPIFWRRRLELEGKRYGFDAKGRPDFVCSATGILGDVKFKTGKGRPLTVHACRQEILARHYAGQMAYYTDGLQANGVEVSQWVWIFVDPVAPFDVVPVIADTGIMDYGRALADTASMAYVRGMALGQWPGVAPRAQLVSLPRYLESGEDDDCSDLDLTDSEAT